MRSSVRIVALCLLLLNASFALGKVPSAKRQIEKFAESLKNAKSRSKSATKEYGSSECQELMLSTDYATAVECMSTLSFTQSWCSECESTVLSFGQEWADEGCDEVECDSSSDCTTGYGCNDGLCQEECNEDCTCDDDNEYCVLYTFAQIAGDIEFFCGTSTLDSSETCYNWYVDYLTAQTFGDCSSVSALAADCCAASAVEWQDECYGVSESDLEEMFPCDASPTSDGCSNVDLDVCDDSGFYMLSPSFSFSAAAVLALLGAFLF